MQRNTDKLANHSFDVIVIGGGVYGAAIANEAAYKGYDVALIEGNDFGSGTSANSLKVLHGGLRYLQHLNFKRMRESIRSRRFYMQLAPNLIDVVPFLIPLSGQGLKGPAAMQAGLLLYSQIAARCNRGVPTDKHLPKGYVIPSKRLQQEIPNLGQHNYSGGGVWYEAVANNTERLVLSLVQAAYEHGAVVANYMRASQVIIQHGRITGIAAHDITNDSDIQIQSRWVIDATGCGIGQLKGSIPGLKPQKTTCARANNVIINRSLFGHKAVGLPVIDNLKDSRSVANRKERMLFFVPWQDKTMVGTFYQSEKQLDGRLVPNKKERTHILNEINRAWPGTPLSEYDICHWHSGWLQMKTGSDLNNIQLSDDASFSTTLVSPDPKTSVLADGTTSRWISTHNSGLIEVRGVKFATAPEVASKTIKRLQKHLKPMRPDKHRGARFTKMTPPDDTFNRHLYNRYGRDWQKVRDFIAESPKNLEPIGDKSLVGELRYIIQQEMAHRLSDVIWRRLPIGECGVDFDTNVAKCAKIMQQECGWSEQRLQQEIENVMNNEFRAS